MKGKKEKLVEFNRKCILEAAKELFGENGVLRTTVDEIARVADCSKATIYVYFKNKDDIYYHVVLEYMIALREELERCSAGAVDYEEAFFALCDALTRFERDYPMYFECILGNISVVPEEMEKLPVLKDIFDVGEEMNDIVCAFLDRAKRDGVVDEKVDSLQATLVMWSGICGWISLCGNKQTYLEKRLEMKQDMCLKNGFEMIWRMVRKGGK